MDKQFDILLTKIKKIVNRNESSKNRLQSICQLLYDNIPYYNWVGFYFPDKNEQNYLLLGPFVGEPTVHVKIKFGQGICGQAAYTKKIFIVEDVLKETNYLSCSAQVKSEIVVPILKHKKFLGELDIDSHTRNAFSEQDSRFLKKVCEYVSDTLN